MNTEKLKLSTLGSKLCKRNSENAWQRRNRFELFAFGDKERLDKMAWLHCGFG
jgi:hypothetical protein